MSAELDKEKADLAQRKDELEQHMTELPHLQDNVKEAAEKLQRREAVVKERKVEIKDCEQTIRNRMRDRGDNDGAYPDNLQALLRAIQQEGRFRSKPIGPMGHHVRLLKPVWSSILEKSFGGSLTGFIVTSKADQTLLSQLMNRTRYTGSVFISTGAAIDTSQNEPDPRYDTWLRVLEIDNDLVRSQLVINHSIEQTLLIEDGAEATAVMFGSRGQSQSHARVRNVKQCFHIHQQKRNWGARLAWNNEGNFSTGPIVPFGGKARMKTDAEQQIAMHRRTLQDLERDLRQCEDQALVARGDLGQCRQAVTDHDKQAKNLKRTIGQIESKVYGMEDRLEQSRPQDGRLAALKETLQDQEEGREIAERSMDGLMEMVREMQDDLRTSRAELAKANQAVAAKEKEIQEAEANSRRLSNERQIALHEKNEAIERVEDVRREKEKREELRDRKEQEIQEYTEKAGRVSARVNIEAGLTPATIERRLERIVQQMQRADERWGAVGSNPFPMHANTQQPRAESRRHR